MSATRTQVYPSKKQRAMLDELSRREGKTRAHLICEAVDRFLDQERPDVEESRIRLD